MRAEPQIIVVSTDADVADILPPGHDLAAVQAVAPADAVRAIQELRAIGTPTVGVIDGRTVTLPPLLNELAVRCNDVPIVVASAQAPPTPSLPLRTLSYPAGSAQLARVVQQLLTSTAQRMRVRTTLDQFNVRLQAGAEPAADERQQRRLLLSDLYLSNILGQAHDAMIITDRDGVVVLWNAAAERLFGIAPQDAVGRRVDHIAADPALAQLQDAITSLSARTRTRALNVVTASPREQHLELSLSLIDQSGAGVAVSVIGRDVSERNALIRQLQDQADALRAGNAALAAARDAADAVAERLSLALQAAGLGDWIWDADTDMVTFSPRAGEIFAIPPGPHMTWTEMRGLLHPDDRERVRAAVERAIVDHANYATEYRLINDGRERWIAASGKPHYAADGRVTGMFGVVQDVTKDRLLVLLDDAVRPLSDPDQITSTAARMVGEHLNVTHCTYARVEADQDTLVVTGQYTSGAARTGSPYRLSVYGPDAAGCLRRGEPYVVSDVRQQARLDHQTRSSHRQIDAGALIAVPILKSGRLVAAMTVQTTAPRRWLRREIELVQQAASRCWESMERARVERERIGLLGAAEAANRAKDEFLAMLGHELRNPLSPIVTALEVMKLRGDGSQQRERDIIERQVTHLIRLVDDLLDVSRITRGKVELKIERVEIKEVVDRAVEMASPLLEQRSHALTLDVDSSGLAVDGDPARLSQVISNLLVNAAKYTPPRGHIRVRARRTDGEVQVQVADNGAGMPAEALEQIFDLFAQGRRSLDRGEGGLGLGLAIVRTLVERHGGSVSARSDGPGRGSEFVVTLPAARTPARFPAADGPARTVSPATGTRVLVVDDNHDAAEMLAEALRLRGYQVVIAHDGPEALALARSTPFAAGFIDIGLPVMDGYELVKHLRRLPGGESLRLVAITGYGQESDRRRAVEAGFDHHLVKPVDVSTVEQWISPPHASRAFSND